MEYCTGVPVIVITPVVHVSTKLSKNVEKQVVFSLYMCSLTLWLSQAPGICDDIE